MTLIVGIKCEDGIVVGADGAATYGAMGQTTIRQETTKLDTHEERVIVGVSGAVGLAQRFKSEVATLWKNNLKNLKPAEAMVAIRTALWDHHLAKEFEVARVTAGMLGSQVAGNSAISQTVIALPLNLPGTSTSVPYLFQFDQQGAPEEVTERLPFVAIGSGQGIADPFLAFIRRLFWPDRLPTLNDGIFSVVWTLQHAILTNPGGISGPIQVVVLRNAGTPKAPNWRTQELAEKELQEHQEAISNIERQLVQYRTLKEDDLSNAPQAPRLD